RGALAVASALALERRACLGEAEAGVVPERLDELEPRHVVGVVQPVGTLGPRGGLEEPDLLVVADRTGGQADLVRDLLDPEQRSGVVVAGSVVAGSVVAGSVVAGRIDRARRQGNG